MRRRGWISAIAIAVLLMAGITFAQGRGGRRGGPDGPGGPGGFGAPGVALRGLDLTDVQQDQIKEIVQRYQQQMRADIMLVLTPDQQQKLKDAEAKREARMKERLNQLQQRRQQRQAQPTPQ